MRSVRFKCLRRVSGDRLRAFQVFQVTVQGLNGTFVIDFTGFQLFAARISGDRLSAFEFFQVTGQVLNGTFVK